MLNLLLALYTVAHTVHPLGPQFVLQIIFRGNQDVFLYYFDLFEVLSLSCKRVLFFSNFVAAVQSF